TRSDRDWSSDVCSSDLGRAADKVGSRSAWHHRTLGPRALQTPAPHFSLMRYVRLAALAALITSLGLFANWFQPAEVQWKVDGLRSEERRVGKECGLGLA